MRLQIAIDMDDIERTKELSRIALKFSEFYKGKVGIMPRVPITSLKDFSYWYTPGVAAVSLAVNHDVEEVFNLTGKWNSVAIVTDGTRVLGLGNVGPEASLPVMEGKSMIFNFLGGVNAVPIPIRVKDKEEFVNVAKALEPSFGAYNLEDIESPKCFFVLEELQKDLSIPVWHDDQLGTACITLAGLLNSLKVVQKRREDAKVVLFGAGAANIATAHLLATAGFKMKNIVIADSKGILEPNRSDIDNLMFTNPWKYRLAMDTNGERLSGEEGGAFKGADIVVSASRSDPSTLHKDWIRSMNDDAIVFALANPLPEIWPSDAIEAGAKIVATGRSDFPNQINNSLVFPGVFRGVLDARARKVDYEIMVAASEALAGRIVNPTAEEVIPKMTDWDLYPEVAASVAYASSQKGYARKHESKEKFLKIATEIIEHNRMAYSTLLDNGSIPKLPEV
jgi:malate dehydrogenase (oxaloacetate-decarboxylating)